MSLSLPAAIIAASIPAVDVTEAELHQKVSFFANHGIQLDLSQVVDLEAMAPRDVESWSWVRQLTSFIRVTRDDGVTVSDLEKKLLSRWLSWRFKLDFSLAEIDELLQAAETDSPAVLLAAFRTVRDAVSHQWTHEEIFQFDTDGLEQHAKPLVVDDDSMPEQEVESELEPRPSARLRRLLGHGKFPHKLR